ncbi:MAG: hypothetical protein ABMA14_17970 [Hyphomonadaceae bacterium]
MNGLRNSVVLGYHGCSAEAAARILNGEDIVPSASAFDWLGPGAYFWEADPRRGLEWALERSRRGDYNDPCVIGAVIDLGNCLDLTVRETASLLSDAYASLEAAQTAAVLPLPQNRKAGADGDVLLRYLDNAVITHLHKTIEEDARERTLKGEQPLIAPFDTVRGLFLEGQRLYPGAGFFAKTHAQLVVRNDQNIKGFFRPRPYPSVTSA